MKNVLSFLFGTFSSQNFMKSNLFWKQCFLGILPLIKKIPFANIKNNASLGSWKTILESKISKTINFDKDSNHEKKNNKIIAISFGFLVNGSVVIRAPLRHIFISTISHLSDEKKKIFFLKLTTQHHTYSVIGLNFTYYPLTPNCCLYPCNSIFCAFSSRKEKENKLYPFSFKKKLFPWFFRFYRMYSSFGITKWGKEWKNLTYILHIYRPCTCRSKFRIFYHRAKNI